MKQVFLVFLLGISFLNIDSVFAYDKNNPPTFTIEENKNITLQSKERMVEIAKKLLQNVRDEKPTVAEIVGRYSREKLLLHPANSEAIKDWSYWPMQRIGLPLELMSSEQMILTQELLWSLLSDYGYAKVLNIMQLEDVLFWNTGPGFPRSKGDYVLVFFGEPSMTESWHWRFEGHHISFNIAVTPKGISLTPTFLGANPSKIEKGVLTGVRIFRANEDLAKMLINSMSSEQIKKANVKGNPNFNKIAESFGIKTFEDAPFDLYGARFLLPKENWEDWKKIPPNGLSVKEMTNEQKSTLSKLYNQILKIYRKEHIQRYKINVDDLNFAYIGSSKPDEMIYYRIQGGDFFYEFGNTAAEQYHVHSVWHDRKDDYGQNLLQEHYHQHHQHDIKK